MPARPTTIISDAASSVGASTLVAERIMRACAPLTALMSSSGERPQLNVNFVTSVAEFLESGVGNFLGH